MSRRATAGEKGAELRLRAAVDAVAGAGATLDEASALAADRDRYEQSLAESVTAAGAVIRDNWLRVVGTRSIEVAQRDEFGDPIEGAVATYRLEDVRVVSGHHFRHARQQLLTRGVPRTWESQLVDVPDAPDGRTPRKVRRLFQSGYGFVPVGGERVVAVPSHEVLAVAAELVDVITQMGRMAGRHVGSPLPAALKDAQRALGI